MTTLVHATVDVRCLAPRERHPLIFSTFRALTAGQAMQLINDHDPKPLYYQFHAELPEQFEWATVEAGPERWRVNITRLAGAASVAGPCCGCCGGR